MRNRSLIRVRMVRALVRGIPALVGASALGCAYSVVPALVDSLGSADTAGMRRTALVRTRSFVAAAFIVVVGLIGDCGEKR